MRIMYSWPGHLLSYVVWLGVAAASPGCVGNVKGSNILGVGGSARSGALPPAPTQMPPPSPCIVPDTPGPRALRRLTNAQIKNTIAAITGDSNAPSNAQLPEGTVLNFLADADFIAVSNQGAELLMDLGESLSAYATSHLGTFAPCQTADAACKKQTVDHIASMFFHGPIPADRLAAYESAAATETDITGVVQFMVAAAVQSPYFVYRRELGIPDSSHSGRYTLTSHEIANEIAYQLTDGPPDSALQTDADADKLTNPATVSAHVQRLLAEPGVQAQMANFFVQWLELDRILSTPNKTNNLLNLTDALRGEMLQQSVALVSETWNNHGGVADLMSSDHTFLNNDLATQVYGMAAVNGGGFVSVPLANTNRAGGLLFESAFLASHAAPDHDSPVQRGVSVLRRVLCQTVPPPPPGVPALMPTTAAHTTRELYEDVHAQGTCKGCHDRMQNIGFLFENYDTAARFRTEDNGYPVDSSGMVSGTSQGNKPLVGNQLAGYLAQLPDVNACMNQFMTYVTFGRATWDQNGCTLDAVAQAAARNGPATLQSTVAALFTVPNLFSRVAP